MISAVLTTLAGAAAEAAAIDSAAARRATACAGGRIVWRIWGDGRSLVLIHGDFGSWTHWIHNVLPLAIYNWFTEGFDTADLKDAKALLDELSA